MKYTDHVRYINHLNKHHSEQLEVLELKLRQAQAEVDALRIGLRSAQRDLFHLAPKDVKALNSDSIIKLATSYVALSNDEAVALRAAIAANAKATPTSPIAQYDVLVRKAVALRDQQQDAFARMMDSGSSHYQGVTNEQVAEAQQVARNFRSNHPEIEPVLSERKAVRQGEIATMLAAADHA